VRKQVKFRLSEDEHFELAVRAGKAGKTVQDYLAGLVADADKVEDAAEQARTREQIKSGVEETTIAHAMDDPVERPARVERPAVPLENQDSEANLMRYLAGPPQSYGQRCVRGIYRGLGVGVPDPQLPNMRPVRRRLGLPSIEASRGQRYTDRA
jgi:hypothetical protein